MDFDTVEAENRAVVRIQKKRQLRAAENDGFDAVLLLHLFDYSLKFDKG